MPVPRPYMSIGFFIFRLDPCDFRLRRCLDVPPPVLLPPHLYLSYTLTFHLPTTLSLQIRRGLVCMGMDPVASGSKGSTRQV